MAVPHSKLAEAFYSIFSIRLFGKGVRTCCISVNDTIEIRDKK